MAILLPPTAITAAVSTPVVGPVFNVDPGPIKNLTIEAIWAAVSGGTSVDVYVQTSFDNGLTWVDIRNFHFTVTASNLVNHSTGTPVTTAVVPTDGSMSSNTSQDGILGSKLRMKYKSSGTYVGGLLAVYASGCELRPA